MELPSDGVVTLSLFVPGDAPVLRGADDDPEHRRRFEFPEDFVSSLQHSLDVIARWEHERISGTRFRLAARDAATATLLGGCEISPLLNGTANLSYWTYPAHRGHGVASRAVALARRWAFEELGLKRLEIVVDPDNAPSRRVALRNGFREVGARDGRILHVADADAGIEGRDL
jgi:RimJ/RimL family protein N-acetyltransferase